MVAFFDEVLSALPSEHPFHSNPGAEEQLEAVLDKCRAAWPEVRLPRSTFAVALAHSLRDNPLEGLYPEDLYLSKACAIGDSPALQLFERVFLPDVVAATAKARPRHVQVGEFAQAIRTHLLLSSATGLPPKIEAYGGKAPLSAWLRVVATRLGVTMGRSTPRNHDDIDSLLSVVAPGEPPELQVLRGRYEAPFRSAFGKAVADLDAEERSLLRMSVIDGLSIDDLAIVFGVHRATAARKLVRVRETLHERTREHLASEAPIGESEFRSIALALLSRIEMSFGRLLEDGTQSGG